MGSEVDEKFRDTVRSFKELLVAVKNKADEELRKSAPSVAASLDKSFETASNAFLDAIETIDKRTQEEQRELLKAYGSFLRKQDELVRKKLAEVERGIAAGSDNSSEAKSRQASQRSRQHRSERKVDC